VTRIVLLDSGPLGLVTNPKRSPANLACAKWLQDLLTGETRVTIPEITDYEVRRELLRAKKSRGLAKLDGLAKVVEYLPLTTEAMRQAAEFWAQARQQGQPTADDRNIDADMILAAQAKALDENQVVIATTNVGHLGRFAPAELWQDINPYM
jgi:predicted nucleic acid-binding protein